MLEKLLIAVSARRSSIQTRSHAKAVSSSSSAVEYRGPSTEGKLATLDGLQTKCIGDDALFARQLSSWAFFSSKTDAVHDVDGHQDTGTSVCVCASGPPGVADRGAVEPNRIQQGPGPLSADRLLHGLPDVLVCSGWLTCMYEYCSIS